MLAELSVKNFALIRELALSFGPGFNVLTGETGAGKSIIVGAVNLILGERASSDLIRDGSDEAEVQALFTWPEKAAASRRLEELGLAGGEEVLIHRVVSRSGRNRIRINGALATLAQLRDLGRDLVNVSGQREHQQLLDPERQLVFLDQFGGLGDQRADMAAACAEVLRLRREVSGLEAEIARAREKAELFDFQVREIEAAGLVPGEDEALEQERSLIRNAEKIYSLVGESFERLYDRSGAVSEVLDAVRADLAAAAEMDPRLASAAAQVEEAYHQVVDAAQVLRDHRDQLTFDPARQEEVEERLALLNRLKRKYGPSLDEVLGYSREATAHLDRLAEMEERLARSREEAEAAQDRARRQAEDLSARRRQAAKKMAGAVAQELSSLGMPRLKFEISFRPQTPGVEPGPSGGDEIEFLIAPNLGEELKPLARIASGGELSRAMLGLKTLLAERDRVQTLVFDEVDAGIGGAVAEVVGRKLRALAAFHQVLCITHLPQIAAYAQDHHLAFKEVRGGRTVTDIRALSAQEKIEEITRMLGGLEPSAKTRAAARELVARAAG